MITEKELQELQAELIKEKDLLAEKTDRVIDSEERCAEICKEIDRIENQ